MQIYGVRSKFVHSGQAVPQCDAQEMQESARQVLLMYWCISMYKSTYVHKEIIAEIFSPDYKQNLMYQSFLSSLANSSFTEKRNSILKDVLLRLIKKN